MEKAANLNDALCYGYERMAAWADLLDRINVFPVADADTGTNLKISLAPLRWPAKKAEIQARRLLMAATGNSGNIAAAFFCELVKADSIEDLKGLINLGRANAHKAVSDPQPGTMLTVMDILDQCVSNGAWTLPTPDCGAIIGAMEKSVAETPNLLPILKKAGVIDAGALGLFIFLEAYLCALFDPSRELRPVTKIFPDQLVIAADYQDGAQKDDYCVNTLIRTQGSIEEVRRALADNAESVVISGEQDQIKIHMHTHDRDDIRRRLSSLGQVANWSEETMQDRMQPALNPDAVHIMTDAAGSFTVSDAKGLGVTLLNSYLIVDGLAWRETHFNPQDLYKAMREGLKVTTAQASLFERQQTYLSATGIFDKILYLCVGSVYTGNFEVASTWQEKQGLSDRFRVIDTGAASGRLGIVAMDVAQYAQTGATMEQVYQYAMKAISLSQEFVFLDQLKYLAAGGRISKTKGFFGDLMRMKPVISPRPEGAEKVGMVRNQAGQLAFAFERLEAGLTQHESATILIEYSDNQTWVEQTAADKIHQRFPNAELILRPLSLTSGAHMGPGTWGVAFLPSISVSEKTR